MKQVETNLRIPQRLFKLGDECKPFLMYTPQARIRDVANAVGGVGEQASWNCNMFIYRSCTIVLGM